MTTVKSKTGSNRAKKAHKQEVAIAALLSSPTIADAASSVGVSEQTLWRWLQEEDFQEAFRDAKRQVLSQSISHLQRVTGEAVDTLRSVMMDDTAPASSRIQASRVVLEYAFKGMQMEEVEARLAAIERVMEEQQI